MAASFALRIHVPAEPQQLFLQFKGTPLRLETVVSSSGPTRPRAAGPRHSTTASNSTRGNDGIPPSAPSHLDQATADGTASCRLSSLWMPSESAKRSARRRRPREVRRRDVVAAASRFAGPMRLVGVAQPDAVGEPTARVDASPAAPNAAIGNGRDEFRGAQLATKGNAAHEAELARQDGTRAPQRQPAPSTPAVPAAPPAQPAPASVPESPAVAECTAPPVADINSAPLTARCQCSTVSFPVPGTPPVALYHCHCTECQKQSASAFGTSALYPAECLFPLSAELAQDLKCYTRPTDSGGRMHCYFCPNCGSRLFHRIVERDGTPRANLSIKAGCIEGLDWRGGKHIYTRSAVVAIPDGVEKYDTLPGEMPRERSVSENPAWDAPKVR